MIMQRIIELTRISHASSLIPIGRPIMVQTVRSNVYTTQNIRVLIS